MGKKHAIALVLMGVGLAEWFGLRGEYTGPDTGKIIGVVAMVGGLVLWFGPDGKGSE